MQKYISTKDMINKEVNLSGLGAPGANTTQTFTEIGKEYSTNVSSAIADAISSEFEKSKPKKKFGSTTAWDLLKFGIKEMPTLFGKYIPQKGIAAIVGSSDVGKSQFARELVADIACKKDFIGWKNYCQYNRVLMVSTEDDDIATSVMLYKLNLQYNLKKEDAENIHFEFIPFELPQNLEMFIQEKPVDAVIIDVFEDILCGSDLNSANAIRNILLEYKRIAQEYNCLILFIHHTNKYTSSLAPNKDNASGSHGFVGAMRLVMELKDDADDPNKFHLCIVKGNYIDKAEKQSSFVLRRDESLVYHNTDERVPFEELAANAEAEKSATKAKNRPEDFGEELHLLIIKGHFSTDEFSKNDVNNCVRNLFMISDKTSRNFTEYYIEKNWLIPTNKGKQPKYKINPALLQ